MMMIQRPSKSVAVAAITFAAFLVLVTHLSLTPIAANDDGSNLIGKWTGDSICVGPFPSCHDEKVIYYIEKPPDASGKVTIVADKIVDGKPELMGVLDFKYDPGKGTLVCDFTRGSTHGVWEFTIKGNTMEGTLIVLPDKILARRVRLKKDTSQPSATPKPGE